MTEIECPDCGELIPAPNVGAPLLETGVPFIRCHGCRKLLVVTLREPSDAEVEDWQGWEANYLGEVG